MSDENLTKRERQKQRRQQRLEQERAQARAARRRRLAVTGLLVLLVLGAIGYLVAQQLQERAELRRAEEEAAARAAEFGCGEVEEPPQLPAGHLQGDPAAIAASPPDVLYSDRPATSGQHLGTWVGTGTYRKAIDERLIVHNLEHGYVTFWYDEQADEAEIDELVSFAEERIEGRFPKIVVARYHDNLPGDANFASVAWGVRQLCESFDSTIATAFLSQHYEPQAAPERLIAPHVGDGQWVRPDETEGDVLFPPLGQTQEDGVPTEAPDAAPTPDGTPGEETPVTPPPTEESS